MRSRLCWCGRLKAEYHPFCLVCWSKLDLEQKLSVMPLTRQRESGYEAYEACVAYLRRHTRRKAVSRQRSAVSAQPSAS